MTTCFAVASSGALSSPGASRKRLPGGAVNPAGSGAAGGFTVMSVSSVTASSWPRNISSRRSRIPSSASTVASTRSWSRSPTRGVAAMAIAARPQAVTGPIISRTYPSSRSCGQKSTATGRLVEAHLGRGGLWPAGRPPGPAMLAVVPLDHPVLVRVLHAVMAAGRDQQRRAAGLEAHLSRQGQAGPVGPVEQSDHFWQVGHDGTIRGESAAGRWDATPFGQIMPWASLGPARLG